MSEVKNSAMELARLHAAEAQVEIQAAAVSPTRRSDELRIEAEVAARNFSGREQEFMSAYDTELENQMAQASLEAAKTGEKAGAWINIASLAVAIIVAAVLLFYLI
ncbi:hypothetical protein ACMSSJ_03340 [Kerstersia gyiorum]|uniref:hypothetical protein n=1 Tax=Kerstersia gyiorum TaxID=206506 RepID=UPI001070C15D|nr:hypothetical protein [Kerstersia gyiorum]QBR41018.1 hypothetical protein EHF36_10540 [Kerstersia gyiorum]